MALKIARREKTPQRPVEAHRGPKKRRGYVGRVMGANVLYFGWYGPLLEDTSFAGAKIVAEKYGLPTMGWNKDRFCPVLLTEREYRILRRELMGAFEWHLTRVKGR